ncbi:MAG: macro domain-containing protein [Pyrinomonadaceae bacterium]
MKVLIADILKSDSQTLINTVNCVGIMGKGIALEFKNRYPEMFDDYVRRCARHEVKPGVPYIYRGLFPPYIINFPTKDHWKSVSRLADIERGLQILLEKYREWEVTSLAIPPLGCGNGQLEWKQVGPMIYHYAKQMDIPVEMYAPYGTPPKELTIDFLSAEPAASAKIRSPPTAMNPAWIGLVEILRQIESNPYHWPVGRIIFQKIAYVATREGLPTGLVYAKGSYGPFSPELKNVQMKLSNSNLLQEERKGQLFVLTVGSKFEQVRQEFQASLVEWKSIIDRTTDLFLRMNSNQAEVVATVIYSADQLRKVKCGPPSEVEVFESVMLWKQKRLEKAEVASAIRNLAMLRWLDVTFDANLPVVEEDEFAPA